jgi:hypothetical protein
VNTNNLTTTSFRIDCSDLLILQKRASELGFKSWGAFIRHVIDCHVMFFEPDLLARLSGPLPPNRNLMRIAPSDALAAPFRSKKQHP